MQAPQAPGAKNESAAGAQEEEMRAPQASRSKKKSVRRKSTRNAFSLKDSLLPRPGFSKIFACGAPSLQHAAGGFFSGYVFSLQ